MRRNRGHFIGRLCLAILLTGGALQLGNLASAAPRVQMDAIADPIFKSSFEPLADIVIDSASVTPAEGSVLPADAIPEVSVRFLVSVVPAPAPVLEVDGVDVTSLAQITSDAIRFLPESALNEGPHLARLSIGNQQLSWSFTTRTAPIIVGESPKDVVLSADSVPFISASWSDVGSGVDASSVMLLVDGVDRTAQAEIAEGAIAYAPGDNLVLGAHHVDLRIADRAGNPDSSAWQFKVLQPPIIDDVAPAGTNLEPAGPLEISASFRSVGSDFDPAQFRLSLNTLDVTAQASLVFADPRTGTIRYVLSGAIEPGPYTASLHVATLDQAAADRVWSFVVAAAGSHDLAFLAPQSNAVVLEQNLHVRIKTRSNRGYATEVRINGMRAQLIDREADGVVYGIDLSLAKGSNELAAVARFSDGAEQSAHVSVRYDAPPEISVTTPLDQQSFGPLARISTDPLPGDARDLTGSVQRPILISGTVSRAVSRVTINQQEAQVLADGTSFVFNNFFLHEGNNQLNVNATDEFGRTGTAFRTVYVDQTAPLLTVKAPQQGAVTSSDRIDVSGVANDAVEVGLNAQEPRVEIRNQTNNANVVATVADRYFRGEGLPLAVGSNAILVTAIDTLGNERRRSIEVTRISAGSRRITMLGGDRQVGRIGTLLAHPLDVVAVDQDGLPIVDLPVQFDVLRGSGTLARTANGADLQDGIQSPRNLVVNTDASGQARLWLTLGNESAEAGNMVRASVQGLAEDVVFSATGQAGAPAWLLVNGLSGSQYAQSDSQTLDALSVVVIDSERNAIRGTQVRFNVEKGPGYFTAQSAANASVAADGRSITVTTDKNGVASVRPYTGAEPGTVHVRAVEATGSLPQSTADFQIMVMARGSGPTRFSGVVLDHTGAPLQGVILSIGRTSLSTVSDASGKFAFDDQVPTGKIDLHVDGTSVHIVRNGENLQYPGLHFETAVVQGQLNQLPHPIYLPPINLGRTQIVGGNSDVRLTLPGMAGFEMIVKANSVTFPDGSRQGPLVVTLVNADRLPMVPPGGFANFGAVAWTIQPTGTRFDPPIEVHIPNVTGLKRGETLPIVQWDHDLAAFVPMGRGTVSEDGTRIVSDSDSGITKAGWGGAPQQAPPNDGCGPSGEPDPEQCLDFENLVVRCPVVAKFTPEITITVTTPSADITTIGDAEYSALSDYTYGFTAALSRGDPQYIEWTTEIKNSDRVSGFNNQAPQNAKGPNYGFGVDITRFTSGSTAESPPVHFELSASMCGEKKTVVVKQDVPDIIRQEYTDFRADVAGFTLSVPARSRLANSTLYTPNSGLTNPYLVNHGISLDDPSQIARSVASAYTDDLRRTSIERYQRQLAATTDPAQQAQIRALMDQVMATTYSPTMTSAWRSPRHNKSVNGVTCSNHLKGGAVDLQPSATTPANIDRTANEHWCALRRACGAAGYNECLLELPRSTGAGWNNDHACAINTVYNAVHSGTEAPCN